MNSDSRKGVQPEPLAAHGLHHDAVLDELDRDLGEVAHALRSDHRILPGRDQEHDRADQGREHGDECDLVERREDVLPAQDLVDRWELEGEHGLIPQFVDAGEGLRPGKASEAET